MSKRLQMKEARRQQIIKVAKDLILEKGILQIQLQDVANAAGIGIATFYRYFSNKELLVLAVHTQITEEMTEAIRNISQQPISAMQMIEKIIMYYIDLADDSQHQFVKYMKAFDAYHPPAKDSTEYESLIDTRRQMAQLLYDIAQKAEQEGEAKESVDITQYIFTVVHNISTFTVESYLIEHDEMLPVKLEPRKQLLLMKDIFLQFIRR